VNITFAVLNALPTRVALLWRSRATISRHVILDRFDCAPCMLRWIDNFEGLIPAFSCDFQFFFCLLQWHSKMWYFVAVRVKLQWDC
jgi:hypothetical protein